MQCGMRYSVATVASRDFTAAIAHGAASDLTNIKLVRADYGRALLRSILIEQVLNIQWRLDFFSKATGDHATNPDLDFWLGGYQFGANTAIRIAGVGLYRSIANDLNFPLIDLDAAGAANAPQQNLHVVISNLEGATDKTADAAGAIKITFSLEPMRES